MAGRAAAYLAPLRRLSTLVLLLQIAVIGAVLGLHSDVFPWVNQLGDHHQLLLVHAAGGVAATLSSAALIGRLARTPVPALLEAAWGGVEACLLVGAGSVLLAAWGRRAEAATHDGPMPGHHAHGYLNADKLAAAGFLAIIAALPSIARFLTPLFCR